jgi:hypothetical protein
MPRESFSSRNLLARHHKADRQRTGKDLDICETECSKALKNLALLPRMAAAAHNPQAPERFLEGIGRFPVQSENEPAPGPERTVHALKHLIGNLRAYESARHPSQSKMLDCGKVLGAREAQLDALGDVAFGKVGSGERQRGLPGVDAYHSEAWPRSCGFDGEAAHTRADIEKRARPLKGQLEFGQRFGRRLDATDNHPRHLAL